MNDIENYIDKTTPPGAEGANQGNGNAGQYMDTSSPRVPVDSKPLSPEEQHVLDEANGGKKKADPLKNESVTPDKKKKGFFKRLFGGK
jgi:penicillin-binding protein 1A